MWQYLRSPSRLVSALCEPFLLYLMEIYTKFTNHRIVKEHFYIPLRRLMMQALIPTRLTSMHNLAR